jgi:AraC-like DNA-binding protein
MNYAVELIHDSKLTIAEIAEKLGYCDQFHFSRQFKKALGKSPIQFRKSGRHAH